MERYTTRGRQGVTVKPDQLPQALERLARFEDLVLNIAREQQEISVKLELLRGQHKDKTVQFRELMSQKLTNMNLLLLLEEHGLKL